MLGYLVHLLIDKYYNDYFFQKHCIFGENGKAHSAFKKKKNKTTNKKIQTNWFYKI